MKKKTHIELEAIKTETRKKKTQKHIYANNQWYRKDLKEREPFDEEHEGSGCWALGFPLIAAMTIR